uniref:Tigger transposable element-derived protein 1 n=1 Tax=Ceratitis capitata TaxID=7213 RepID=W8B3D1_CERCA
MSCHKRSEETLNDTATNNKRRRRSLTTEEKIKLLDRLNIGDRPVDLSREFEISDSTIRSYMTSEAQLRKYEKECTMDRSATYFPRDDIQEKMEHLLLAWYEKQCQESKGHSMGSICTKAREIYGELRYTDGNAAAKKSTTGEFKASLSWLANFRKRHDLKFRAIHKNKPVDPISANVYIDTFAKLLRTGGYQPHQVFSAFELSFAWKRLPGCTSIAMEDKFRDRLGNDRISLLLCSNAEGDFYVKPMLIHRTRKPQCLRFTKISELPVFWRCRGRETQSLPKVTPSHFHDWLIQCFTPTVRNYLKLLEKPEYCLLLLSSDLSQMVLPTYDESFLSVESLPEKTTQLLHPLIQSALPVFNSKYLHRFVAQLAQCLEDNSEGDLYKAWQKYSIADAIHNIHKSLEDINAECWRGGWHRLWPEIANELCHNAILTDEIMQIIVQCRLLHGKGLDSIDFEEIKQHLKVGENISNDDQQTKNESQGEEAFPNENLLNNCSRMDFESAANNTENSDDEISIIHFSDDEPLQSDEEAVIEFHQTEDVNIEFGEAKTKLTKGKVLKVKQVKARTQINLINKAFNLSHELVETLRQLETTADISEFSNGIQDLMQPYAELKKKLLQPSIKDFFKSELTFP